VGSSTCNQGVYACKSSSGGVKIVASSEKKCGNAHRLCKVQNVVVPKSGEYLPSSGKLLLQCAVLLAIALTPYIVDG
jgi:hypothetical protein